MTLSQNHQKNLAQRSTSYVALGCVGAIICVAAPAAAQDQATTLEGVVVTDSTVDDGYKADAIKSPKATAALIDTPRTVSVVTRDVIENSASFSFQEALRNVPGITLGAGEGGTASADIPFIRGGDATSDTYVDGARDVGSQTRETFAVERIEVFKGPNSAFGGRGGAGGTINIVSKLPQAESFIAGQATIGTDNLQRVTVDVNQMITDTIGVRVNGLWHDSDVAGRDAIYDDRWGIAPSIAAGLGTKTVATLSYYHYETKGIPDYGIPYTSRLQLDGTGVPDGTRVIADVDYDNFYGLVSRDFQETDVDSVTFQFSHTFDSGWAITNINRWSHARDNYIVTNPDDSAGNVANDLVWRAVKSRNSVNDALVSNLGVSGEFKTGGISHSVAFGGELSTAKTTNLGYVVATGDSTCPASEIGSPNYNCTDLYNPDPYDPWNGSIETSTTPTVTRADSIGFYGFDTITITPKLLVNLGVRWEQFDVSAKGTSRGVPYEAENKTSNWSYQAGVIFKPVENASIYASFADSATPPGSDVGEGSQSINGTSATYDPQITRNYEVGAKYDALNGALSLTAALFRTDTDNVRNDTGLGEIEIIPGTRRVDGFELGAAGRIGPVSLSGGYVYLDSEIRGDGDAGNRFPNTAKHNLSLWSNVTVTDRLSFGGGAYYTGKRYADTGNLIAVPDYWRFDATAAFQATDNISVRANIQNLTDERYIIKPRNPHFAVPGAGRQALLTVAVRY